MFQGAGSGTNSRSKPPATNGRLGPNTKPISHNANSKRSNSRGPVVADGDDDPIARGQYGPLAGANQRNNSANKRRNNQAAAAYHASSDTNGINAAAMNNIGSKQPKKDNGFEFTDSLMEKLGTPDMLLKELKMAKRDIETLKN